MSASSTPTWILAASRRRTSYGDLRISDAERTEIADFLSKNYGDGRLDQAEFNERLDHAMKAKTYSDLSGLLDDLPRPEGSGPAREPHQVPGRRYPVHRVLFMVLVVVITAAAWHAVTWTLAPWIWIGLLVMIVLYATRGHRT